MAMIYVEHSIGLTGANLDKIHKAAQLTDDGRRLIVIAGDFNIEPEEWGQTILDTMGVGIVTAGKEKTCKTNGDSKQYDYLLVSTDLIPYIGDVKLEADVPWGPMWRCPSLSTGDPKRSTTRL